MGKRHNGRRVAETVEPLTAEEFSKMTIGELYDLVEQSGEQLFTLALNGQDGKPFAMFALALGAPEKLEQYAKALNDLKPTAIDAAVGGALNG